MKFLLAAVNAKFIHSNPAVYSLRAFVGEELEKHVEIAEYTINQSGEDILADIYHRQPDVIAFSCYIWNWRLIQDILADLPKVLCQVPVWLGGPEVSFGAKQVLERNPMVTGIMVGEGELTFRELLSRYVEADKVNIRLDDIAGLCLPFGETGERELVSLDTLPFLYRNPETFTNRIIYYESSRGCPYRCSYCLSSIDKSVRLRDINVVKKELQFFLEHKVSQVKFVDRTFNCNYNHATNIWKYILEHDNGVTNFHFEIAADLLKEDQIKLLHRMRPGLIQLEIGVQSVNTKTIQAINRIMDVDRLEKIVAAIHEGRNIHQHLDLIAGLPYEDYKSFGQSFDRVYAMKPQQLQLGFLKVLKGSAMYDKVEEYGISYQDTPPYEVLFTKWLPYEDVLKLKQIEQMVELYYNSSQYTYTLKALAQAFGSPFAMFEALASFYESRGYFLNSPSRAYRFEVLLEFAEEYDGRKTAIYRELLTFDMYLRENMKSRPAFAPDLTPYKETFRAFFRQEAEAGILLPAYKEYDARQLMKMTHLEPFCYPVWDMPKSLMTEIAEDGKLQNQGVQYYVLFDYWVRNPLNYAARAIVLDKNMSLLLETAGTVNLH